MDYQEQINFLQRNNLPAEKLNEYVSILTMLKQQETSMSRKEILAYAKKIKPLMRKKEQEDHPANDGNGCLFWLKSTAIHSESCTYTPVLLHKAEGLHEIARITTYHRYGGYPMFLRPSADEAIYQCPKEILDKVCAFEFIAASDKIHEVYNLSLDRHILTTVYYTGVLPQEIANEEIRW